MNVDSSTSLSDSVDISVQLLSFAEGDVTIQIVNLSESILVQIDSRVSDFYFVYVC